MTEGNGAMQTNGQLQVNLWTFNAPTIAAVITVGAMVFNVGQAVQKQESRITNIETSRAERQIGYAKQAEAQAANAAATANLTYRLTTLEATVSGNNIATNARVDRQTDSIQDFRSDLAKVNTSIELLSQQIKILLPEKKAELDMPPPELASR